MSDSISLKIKASSPSVSAGQLLTLKAKLSGTVPKSFIMTWYFQSLNNVTLTKANNTVIKPFNDGTRTLYVVQGTSPEVSVYWDTTGVAGGRYPISVYVFEYPGEDAAFIKDQERYVTKRIAGASVQIEVLTDSAVTPVSMRRAYVPPTSDQALWTVIRKSANALSFDNYQKYMEIILCGERISEGVDGGELEQKRKAVKHRLRLPFPDTDAYRQLKVATEVFMMVNCGVNVGDPRFDLDPEELEAERRRYYDLNLQGNDIEEYWTQLLEPITTESGTKYTLPYLALIRKKLSDVPVLSPNKRSRSFQIQEEEAAVECLGILMRKLTQPCLLELIWSYWHEEGMLVQAMNAITWRFQNRRGPMERDPLAFLEIDPLRPLNNFLWGYIQDEQHRLTVVRRAYEYDHHYGLPLLGKAVPPVRGADSRTRFLEGFHHLLHLCSMFFKEDDDTTVVADGFPVLNALKEVHMLLTQGQHNQYGDLPWTARQEMLMQEWFLARPEMREFLPSRTMVDYPEPWMDRVETMKTLQGWTDSSVLHFRDLGVFGEQILLGIRFGAWPSVIEPQQAANWARYWRPEVQGYVHAYRAVTGMDLTNGFDATPPAILLRRRLGELVQQTGQSVPAARARLMAPRVRP
jgi:hypothetical protein